MKKTILLAVMLTMVLVVTVPAVATSYVYGSCAEIPTQEEAQQILESSTYGIAPYDPEDPISLDPDGDGVACNNDGNLAADGFAIVEPEVCLEGQAAMVCPEGSIVVRYGEDGHVYDESGNEYVLRCVGPHIPNTYQPCEWIPVALPM